MGLDLRLPSGTDGTRDDEVRPDTDISSSTSKRITSTNSRSFCFNKIFVLRIISARARSSAFGTGLTTSWIEQKRNT